MPKSKDTISFLLDAVSSRKKLTKKYFVRLQRTGENWKWSKNTPFIHRFKKEKNEHDLCGVIDGDSLLKTSCSSKAAVVCEKKTGCVQWDSFYIYTIITIKIKNMFLTKMFMSSVKILCAECSVPQ